MENNKRKMELEFIIRGLRKAAYNKISFFSSETMDCSDKSGITESKEILQNLEDAIKEYNELKQSKL